MAAAALAQAAAFEVASREKHHPAMIAAGEIERTDADADLAAWRAIAAMLAVPGNRNPRLEVTDLPWETLELAARRAAQRLAERVPACPERCRAVAEIADWLASERRFWTAGRPAEAA